MRDLSERELDFKIKFQLFYFPFYDSVLKHTNRSEIISNDQGLI